MFNLKIEKVSRCFLPIILLFCINHLKGQTMKIKAIMLHDDGAYRATEIEVQKIRGQYIYEGDILIPAEMVISPKPKPEETNGISFQQQTQALTTGGISNKRWPGGVIPYSIATGIRPNNMRSIDAAIKEINKKTNLCLVQKNSSHRNYVEFVEKDIGFCGGRAYVGMIPVGKRQEITLNTCNVDWQLVAHEILHAAGFHHEQTRPDRDKYVEIIWSNIENNAKSNFRKGAFRKGIGNYDFTSIMHYRDKAFAKDSKKLTIKAKDAKNQAKIKRNGLSVGDISGIATVYKNKECTRNTSSIINAGSGRNNCTPKGKKSGVVRGKVYHIGQNTIGYRVTIFDRDKRGRKGDKDNKDDKMCSVITNAKGEYRMSYDRSTLRWDQTRWTRRFTQYRPDIYAIVEQKLNGKWVRVHTSKEYKNHRMSDDLVLNLSF